MKSRASHLIFQSIAINMRYLTFALFVIMAIMPLISGNPAPAPVVVVNGVCLDCPNRQGTPVNIGGQEYRSFSNGESGNNVVISRPGYNDGRTTVYRRGGNTVVNGRCEICNVDV